MGALMLRMDDARARIEDRVPEIRRFGNAADFAAVVASNRLPTTTPVAYVLFAGLHGGKPTASAGLFIQDYDEVLTVILADRITGDPTGDKALKDVAPLVAKVVEAVCGWAPDDAAGVFQAPATDPARWLDADAASFPRETLRPDPALLGAQPKPIVWYGTSIAQGGVASRPGMAFTNILSRRLGRPVLNFGFSGNGHMDVGVGVWLAQLDAALKAPDTASMLLSIVRELEPPSPAGITLRLSVVLSVDVRAL